MGILGVTLALLFAVLAAQASYVQFFHADSLNSSPVNDRIARASSMYARGDIIAADGTLLARSVPTTSGAYPWQRNYPLGALTSGVVGFSSPIYGTWGLEYYYNNDLLSHPQSPQSLSQILVPERAPNTLLVTLQPQLQAVAQKALGDRNGAVVAIDPKTGGILAMYSSPNYDPAPLTSSDEATASAAWTAYNKKNYRGFPPLGLLATQQTFAPGSTYKVITTAAAIMSKPELAMKKYPMKAYTKLPTSDKLLWNSGHTPCGGKAADMLPGSCDPGFALLGLDLGAEIMSSTATNFGYNQAPPIDLPGVVTSYFPDASLFSNDLPGLAYSAIGQKDVRATALTNALVAAGIANNGQIMTPHFMNMLTKPDGTIVKRYKPHAWLTPVDASAAKRLTGMMLNVTRFGTAAGIFRGSDLVAAKTGTAQTGNSANNTHDWMIAFAPANNPVVAVAVVVPFQHVDATGAAVAGPIMRCVIQGAIALSKGQPASGTASTCPR